MRISQERFFLLDIYGSGMASDSLHRGIGSVSCLLLIYTSHCIYLHLTFIIAYLYTVNEKRRKGSLLATTHIHTTKS